MFCPKCGTENNDNGKFCRKCGTNIGAVTNALSGNKAISEDLQQKLKKKKTSWESAVSTSFMGLAFLVVSIILAFQPMGRGWWFWMLIPAFAMIGTGVSKIIYMRSYENNVLTALEEETKTLSESEQQKLPPKQTEFVSNIPDSKYQTGDLVPPSVVENTTRHLEMDSEGDTMTLPKQES